MGEGPLGKGEDRQGWHGIITGRCAMRVFKAPVVSLLGMGGLALLRSGPKTYRR